MRASLKKRLLKLEALLPSSGKKHRAAKIICDPDVIHSLDFSEIDAEVLLILPDNGHRLCGDQKVPKGSYLVTYS
jgi:hypothetical protein